MIKGSNPTVHYSLANFEIIRLHLLLTVGGVTLCRVPTGVLNFGGVAIIVAVATGPSTPGDKSGET